jgi:iron complex transport system substrate-binding protein
VSGRHDDLAARVRPLPRKKIVCLEWIEPQFTMGNWGPELVEIAGGASEGVVGAPSTTTTWDRVRAADPDVLLVAPCGFALERAWREMQILSALPGFHELRRVVVADGNLYFNRSSPSIVTSAEILAEILHPEIPAAHHEAWRDWR